MTNQLENVNEVNQEEFKLTTENVFVVARFVKSAGLISMFKGTKFKVNEDGAVETEGQKDGLEFIDELLGIFLDNEEGVYELLAKLKKTTIEEIRQQDFDITLNMFAGIFQSKALKRFF